MSPKNPGIKRRDFLKGGALAGLGALLGNSIVRTSYAASKERLTILSSISLDTLHPYAYSSSPQYGIWNHMIEPASVSIPCIPTLIVPVPNTASGTI